ncbi:AAA family ATPase [Rhizobium leguminosarum]|uniref:AAA family ATPase n=1 Tax=Rhizobium leguminosarum TaxID=384 RepID=UPI001C925993|nr:AAA family ATPase [Rhizobium leguminosarum]MBY2994472.1 AAA family ATPase [Rhizobium leguminosarum]MBY3058900.1 AAA family ATPase [Rhizobium leguminosarum]
MPKVHSGKRARVPWKSTKVGSTNVTLPVFMAYCAIAAALRPWNNTERKTIITLVFNDDYYRPVYSHAAQVFGREIWNRLDYDTFVYEWSDKSFRDQALAERNQAGIFLSPPKYQLTDDEALFSDAVIQIGPRSRRHAQAALRRAGLPVDEKLVDLLVSEPWSRLYSAFQDRRGPLQALERLRRQQLRKPNQVKSEPDIAEAAGPTLEDMHGFGPALDWGYDLAKDLADYKAGLIRWRDVDAGVLISGPPGIGKTMFASALANTCRVTVIYGSVSRWQEAGALDDHLKAMRASFAKAEKEAPSILFIDEVDTFSHRSYADRNSGYFRAMVTGLLELLDGFVRREGVVVVAACNHPNVVDAAILRAGRLDRHMELTLPDGTSRLGILKYHCGIGLSRADAEMFVLATEGFSGADIEQLVRGARRTARRKSADLNAVHIIDQLPMLEKLPEDYLRAVAVHEAGHAVAAFETGREISGITISRFRAAGHVRELGRVDYEPPATRVRIKATYLDSIAVCLAGIAAEIEVFGAFADGASGASEADLNRATEIATVIEGVTGMGHTLIVEPLELKKLAMMRLYNADLRRQVHQLLENELARTRSIIQRQRPALDALAERLMETATMTGEEVVQVLRRHRRSVVSLAKPILRTGT